MLTEGSDLRVIYTTAMVRRTKAEAEQTRHKLLDAAEQLFLQRGVSRTSLNDIATAAGTTRGAIYWHFEDKADLFNAMMERVTLPLEQALQSAAQTGTDAQPPLKALLGTLMLALRATMHDPQTRRVFEIATHKVEYVDELHAVAQRRNECIRDLLLMTEQALTLCSGRQGITLPMSARNAALGLHMLVDGLINNWLMDPQAFDLEEVGEQTLRNYLRGLGLVEQP
jgi:TetR/AcrR family acrAB operon transcriptional repressor